MERAQVVFLVGGVDAVVAGGGDGTIRAVGNTFKLAVGDDGELVSVMVPESAFRKGRNDVQVLEVR